jgi:hypothetical protein
MLDTSNNSTYLHSSGIPVLWLLKFKLVKFHLELAAQLFTIDKKTALGQWEVLLLENNQNKHFRILEEIT